jgi:hypothetical protein
MATPIIEYIIAGESPPCRSFGQTKNMEVCVNSVVHPAGGRIVNPVEFLIQFDSLRISSVRVDVDGSAVILIVPFSSTQPPTTTRGSSPFSEFPYPAMESVPVIRTFSKCNSEITANKLYEKR